MADYVDVQYATILASRFPRFAIKNRNPLKINFRCPECGDSKKSPTKARGWISENQKTQSLFFSCFNCGAAFPFGKFLKAHDPSLHNDYIADKFLNNDNSSGQQSTISNPPKPNFMQNPLAKIKKISQLKPNHPAKKYIESRQIPSDQHYRLYYVPKFKTWINDLIPNKFEDTRRDEPRLVIPLIGSDGKVFGVSARGFDPNGLRYITIMFEDKPKLFGLDKVDFTKPYFVTEGALDAMFLSNSIAMVGADAKMEGLENTENATFVHDAEPRNLEICKRMEKLLVAGYKVCVWPTSVPAKDINDMILAGMKDVEQIIIKNSYSGLEGRLMFQSWKKC